jgi:hypothetical protein
MDIAHLKKILGESSAISCVKGMDNKEFENLCSTHILH